MEIFRDSPPTGRTPRKAPCVNDAGCLAFDRLGLGLSTQDT